MAPAGDLPFAAPLAVAGLPFASKAPSGWTLDDTEGVPIGLPDLVGRRPDPEPAGPSSAPPLSVDERGDMAPSAAPAASGPPLTAAAEADAESSDVFALPEEVVAEAWAPPAPASDVPEPPAATGAVPGAEAPAAARSARVAELTARVEELTARAAELEVAAAAAGTRLVVVGLAALAAGAGLGALAATLLR